MPEGDSEPMTSQHDIQGQGANVATPREDSATPGWGAPAASRGPKPAGGKRLASVDPPGERRCSATTKAGDPCPVRALAGSNPPLCYQHSVDPRVAEQRALARRLGGLQATTKRLPRELPPPDLRTRDGVRSLLESTTAAVLNGDIAPSVANSVSQLASVALRLVEIELDAQELALTQEAARSKAREIVVMEAHDAE